MRKSNIRKMVAANRSRMAMPGMGAMAKVAKTMGQAPSIPGGTAAPMKKGGKAYANGGITTAKMGAVKTAAPSRDGVAAKGKTKGTQIKMAGAPKGMKKGGKAC